MKIKSFASLALLTTAPMVTAQPIIKQLEEDLKKDCDSVKNYIKDFMENTNHPHHKFYKQKITNTKNSDLSMRCKTDTLIHDTLVGFAHEGLSCYVKDKLEKAKNGGIAVIAKHRLKPAYKNLLESNILLKSYNIKDRGEDFIIISSKHASKESKTIFDAYHENNQSNQDYAFISFGLGHQEVPDFDKALYSLKNKTYRTKIPAEIMHTAISSDPKLSDKEKKYIIEALEIKNNDEYLIINDKNLKNAAKKTLDSITDDCVNKEKTVFVKGLSLTKSSTYQLQQWDITPLKEWVSNKMKDEL